MTHTFLFCSLFHRMLQSVPSQEYLACHSPTPYSSASSMYSRVSLMSHMVHPATLRPTLQRLHLVLTLLANLIAIQRQPQVVQISLKGTNQKTQRLSRGSVVAALKSSGISFGHQLLGYRKGTLLEFLTFRSHLFPATSRSMIVLSARCFKMAKGCRQSRRTQPRHLR